MIELARQYGRYGYRRIAALLRDAGWQVNDKRVERLWRREGLKVPSRQPKKGRLWLNDGSCVRLRPEYRDHIWSYDFVHCRTDDGKVFRTLNILDEFSRECLTIRVRRKLNSTDVIDVLTDHFTGGGSNHFKAMRDELVAHVENPRNTAGGRFLEPPVWPTFSCDYSMPSLARRAASLVFEKPALREAATARTSANLSTPAAFSVQTNRSMSVLS